jgi:CheY-like chemotaxis protein
MFNKIIVVVDDDKISRMLPGAFLRPYGVTVLECESGKEALELLNFLHVNCILIDISMSEFGGLDLVKKIRRQKKHLDLKIVAYTANAHFAEKINLIEVGFNTVLIKPYHARDLLKAIGFNIA